MAELIAIGYDDETTAQEAADEVRRQPNVKRVSAAAAAAYHAAGEPRRD
jgi:hypothetical protein